MHIHPPKPLHGWREFIGEVGIIVLGILIAVAFEQVVEQAHWRHKVDQATDALAQDMHDTAILAAEQQASEPCVTRQLADLQARLVAPGPFKPVPVYNDGSFTGFTFRRPLRLWDNDVWNTIAVEGVSTHLPPGLRDKMRSIYLSISKMRDTSAQADMLSWRLSVLGLPIEPQPAERVRLLEDLAELRGRLSLMNLIAGQLLWSIGQVRMLPPTADLDDFMRNHSHTIAFCREHHWPLGRLHAIPT